MRTNIYCLYSELLMYQWISLNVQNISVLWQSTIWEEKVGDSLLFNNLQRWDNNDNVNTGQVELIDYSAQTTKTHWHTYIQWWKVNRYIYSKTIRKYKCKMFVFNLFPFSAILPLHYILRENVVLDSTTFIHNNK